MKATLGRYIVMRWLKKSGLVTSTMPGESFFPISAMPWEMVD